MLYNTLSLYVVSIVNLSCMCTAGLFQRLLRPRWGCAAETTGDDGEQQLRVSNSRLWQNNWCVTLHRLFLMHCVRSVQSLLFSANVLNVSCVTVAHTVFGLQIAGVKPSETWPIEAVGTKTAMILLNDEWHLYLIVYVPYVVFLIFHRQAHSDP